MRGTLQHQLTLLNSFREGLKGGRQHLQEGETFGENRRVFMKKKYAINDVRYSNNASLYNINPPFGLLRLATLATSALGRIDMLATINVLVADWASTSCTGRLCLSSRTKLPAQDPDPEPAFPIRAGISPCFPTPFEPFRTIEWPRAQRSTSKDTGKATTSAETVKTRSTTIILSGQPKHMMYAIIYWVPESTAQSQRAQRKVKQYRQERGSNDSWNMTSTRITKTTSTETEN